jgi:hypothetical protein
MEVNSYLSYLTGLLNQAIHKLNKLEYDNYSRQMIIQAKKNVQRYNDIINRTICSVLEADSSEFREVAQKSFELLSNNRIQFKSYRKDLSVSASNYENLSGKLHSNGRIYCLPEESSDLFSNFPFYSFPVLLEGKIDSIGNVSLRTTKHKNSFIRRVPVLMEGSINMQGVIKLRTTEQESDSFFSNPHIASRFISTYTFRSVEKENDFYQNKKILLGWIDEYRKKQKIPTGLDFL